MKANPFALATAPLALLPQSSIGFENPDRLDNPTTVFP
ncbi:hypothetical protein SAMN05878503_10798 [Cereibacter ovatus]|uniref:Uncharacterized protein n=1 Tax=Cereibacter ovatus TaxID=439529 RepID=A0A285CTZ2_9RHOB|nr:hypothetical protein SAMN05878503_10798 [Cereibacter ovatus]